MNTSPQLQILYAERMMNGIVISFSDGKSALYSGSLLRSMFHHAQEIPQDDPGKYFDSQKDRTP